MRYVFTVAEVVQLRGRGLILSSGPNCNPQARVFIGGSIELRKPNGQARSSKVAGIGILDPNPFNIFEILLPADIMEHDVPLGTEVWSDEVMP